MIVYKGGDHKDDQYFQYCHVKGMARASTLLAGLHVLHTAGKKVATFFPQIASTARAIHVKVETHVSVTSVALRNAILSHKGSIRKAHCAVTWTGKLLMLKRLGQSGDAIIKQYNQLASVGGQLNGGKRSSILALMMVPTEVSVQFTSTQCNSILSNSI